MSCFDPWMARNNIEGSGFQVVSERCNHSFWSITKTALTDRISSTMKQ